MSNLPFIGRKEELASLHDLTHKKTSSLVALRGRRRIGKSRLIEEFARQRKNCRFLPFSGLVPSNTTTADAEKEEFSRRMSVNLGLHQIKADGWDNMFSYLAKETIRNIPPIGFILVNPNLSSERQHAYNPHFFRRSSPRTICETGGYFNWCDHSIA